ncbi:hypothetical protein B5V02_24010 [Mesorhizobium kowhaii]|uniref:Uncharacterized protein n=1 Tax=Mesorhizobium kowhaii TaxID=1300272 RepID=A0A2W7BZI7_9HYPH|nr:hypothetical protein B5V02_24010 [Mesorhizobium kowhaii]
MLFAHRLTLRLYPSGGRATWTLKTLLGEDAQFLMVVWSMIWPVTTTEAFVCTTCAVSGVIC